MGTKKKHPKKSSPKEVSEMELVDAASKGCLFEHSVEEGVGGLDFTPVDVPAVFQSERGTWLTQNESPTPPLECRKWVCAECYKFCDSITRIMGVRCSISIIQIWQRLKNINYLRLRSEVKCYRCDRVLNGAREALVEVF